MKHKRECPDCPLIIKLSRETSEISTLSETKFHIEFFSSFSTPQTNMSDIDILNIDNIIARLLEGKNCYDFQHFRVQCMFININWIVQSSSTKLNQKRKNQRPGYFSLEIFFSSFTVAFFSHFHQCFHYSYRNVLFLVRGSRPGKNVQLTESEIRGLCLKSREIFLSQPILLELEAPLKICGE